VSKKTDSAKPFCSYFVGQFAFALSFPTATPKNPRDDDDYYEELSAVNLFLWFSIFFSFLSK
jgi:hypothetical protein